jgi:hypothetical protein
MWLIHAGHKKTVSCFGGCQQILCCQPSPKTSYRFLIEADSSGKKTQKAKAAFFSSLIKHFFAKPPVIAKKCSTNTGWW